MSGVEPEEMLARVRADEARTAAIDGRLIELVRERWTDSGLMWDRSAAVDAIEAVLGALSSDTVRATPDLRPHERGAAIRAALNAMPVACAGCGAERGQACAPNCDA